MNRRQAEIVKKYRLRKRLAQQQVGKALGFNTGQMISNIERGLCGYGNDQITKLSIILGVSPRALAKAKIKDFEEQVLSEIIFS